MFDTLDDVPNPRTAQPIDGKLAEPNPEPGLVLRLVLPVDHAPVGSEVTRRDSN